MSKSKGKRFILPKPSNNENLNTDFSSRLEYYDDEKRGILNIVRIKPRPVRKSTPKSTPKSATKSTPKTPKPMPKPMPKSATKMPKSATKFKRVMSRT